MLESPSDYFEKIYNKISENERITFISTILFGIACHIFMITNKLPNHDELQSYRYLGYTVINGRPFMRFAQYISGSISSPWIQGVVAIFYIAVIGLLINRLFNLKSRLSSLILGLTMVTFPTVASCLGHMYSADMFFFSILCGVISVYGVNSINGGKGLYKYIIMMALILGIGMCVYQITIAYAATLIVILLIVKELRLGKDLDNKDWFSNVKMDLFKFFLLIVISFGIYFIILKVSLVVTGEMLTDRKGIGSAGMDTIRNIPYRVLEAYKQFFWYVFKRDSHTTYSLIAKIASSVSAISVFISSIYLAYKGNIFKNHIKTIYFVLLIILFPLSVQSIYVLVQNSSDVNYHMHQSLVLWFVFIVVIFDLMVEYCRGLVKESKKSINTILWIFIICISFMQWDNWLFTANAYNAAYLAYEQAYAYSLELSVRIKQIEDFSYDKPIAFVGKFNYADKPATLSVLNSFTKASIDGKMSHPVTSLPGELTLLTTYAYPNFFVYYLGNNFNFCSKEKSTEISNLEQVKNMPIYPQEGSIKVIDGVIVINR